jgi:hypothetical protein
MYGFGFADLMGHRWNVCIWIFYPSKMQNDSLFKRKIKCDVNIGIQYRINALEKRKFGTFYGMKKLTNNGHPFL